MIGVDVAGGGATTGRERVSVEVIDALVFTFAFIFVVVLVLCKLDELVDVLVRCSVSSVG